MKYVKIAVPDGTPDDFLRDLEEHARGRYQVESTYEVPAAGWTCFHCGGRFRTVGGAQMHFGDRVDQTPAACREAVEALQPFARYGAYMEEREPGWYDRGLYYGVKHEGAPQVRRTDFRRAQEVMRCQSRPSAPAGDPGPWTGGVTPATPPPTASTTGTPCSTEPATPASASTPCGASSSACDPAT